MFACLTFVADRETCRLNSIYSDPRVPVGKQSFITTAFMCTYLPTNLPTYLPTCFCNFSLSANEALLIIQLRLFEAMTYWSINRVMCVYFVVAERERNGNNGKRKIKKLLKAINTFLSLDFTTFKKTFWRLDQAKLKGKCIFHAKIYSKTVHCFLNGLFLLFQLRRKYVFSQFSPE